jgi:hypothetical protein
MGNGYFLSGYKDKISYFDVFYRKNPFFLSINGYEICISANLGHFNNNYKIRATAIKFAG